MSNKLRGIKPRLMALSIYQIIGGVLGIGLTLWMINLTSVSSVFLLLVLFVCALYGYSIYCGVLLLQERKDGLVHSKINQLLQVVSFSLLGYAYQFTSGAALSVGLDLTESLSFKFNLSASSWQVNINSDSRALIVNVNLLALFLIRFIDKTRKRRKGMEVEAQVAAIGQPLEEQPLTPAL
jgi:hypothetical protein